ncbi:MAG: 3-phosphoshikimate 1-carboxyvinyltransferase, partial [Planctomycetes bacterium]|nr:3-phosphoshikimate 1-carboxyvinyltransferase [Planctomycetota bacterium]
FFSALLMVAPYAAQDVEIQVIGDLVSKPYIDMTIGSMRDFGVQVQNRVYQSLRVRAGQRYTARDYSVEGDASAASYFFAAAAIVGGKVRVEGIDRGSLQGDIGFLSVLEQMGCTVRSGDGWAEVEGGKLRGVDVDMNAMSDVAQTLAAVAVFADGKTRIRNIAHVRGKETDRIAATATELRKLGADVTEFPDGLEIAPCPPRRTEIATYDDHRMAMSFALIGLRAPGIRIQNPGCVSKTFPNFFDELERLG